MLSWSPNSRLLARSAFIAAPFLLWPVFLGTSTASEIDEDFFVKVKQNSAAKDWQNRKTTLLKHLPGFAAAPVTLSAYGGRTDRKEEATGFFYTRMTGNGWVMVDPEGCHYLSIGVCSTSPHDDVPDHKEAFANTFVDSTDWAKQTRALLVDKLKFNSLGCWSDWMAFKTAQADVPYVRRWNLMADYGQKKGITNKQYGHAGFRDDILPVFDKGFAEHCDEACRKMAETRNDPWLIGHFSDNELPFKSRGILRRYLTAAPDDESYAAASRFLKEKGIDNNSIEEKHDIEFTSLVLKTYYRIVHDAIRKHDPNHLILGSRLHGIAASQDVCYTASGPFVDVVSINYYHRWTPVNDELNRWAELARKPILVTEWYAKGSDSGLNNSMGAGFTVPTQKERGSFYENFTIGLLRNRNVVGWHWFRYIDDGDLKTKGHSCNKGIVDLSYKEYDELGSSISAINSVVYPLSDFLRGQIVDPSIQEPDQVNNDPSHLRSDMDQ